MLVSFTFLWRRTYGVAPGRRVTCVSPGPLTKGWFIHYYSHIRTVSRRLLPHLFWCLNSASVWVDPCIVIQIRRRLFSVHPCEKNIAWAIAHRLLLKKKTLLGELRTRLNERKQPGYIKWVQGKKPLKYMLQIRWGRRKTRHRTFFKAGKEQEAIKRYGRYSEYFFVIGLAILNAAFGSKVLY